MVNNKNEVNNAIEEMNKTVSVSMDKNRLRCGLVVCVALDAYVLPAFDAGTGETRAGENGPWYLLVPKSPKYTYAIIAIPSPIVSIIALYAPKVIVLRAYNCFKNGPNVVVDEVDGRGGEICYFGM